MGFAVERTSTSEGVGVTVVGDVDIETAPRMRDAISAALATGDSVVVDLAAVTFMDSAGLSALIAVRLRARAEGLSLRLDRVPDRVANLFRITGMDELLLAPDA
jgi:anti-sigma B factor antagonist